MPLQPGLQAQQHFQQPMNIQYVQQHQHQQFDWICPTCTTIHPYFHMFCAICQPPSGGKGKGKSKGKDKGKTKSKGNGKSKNKASAGLIHGKGPAEKKPPPAGDSHAANRPGRWRSGAGVPAHWHDAEEYDMSIDVGDDDRHWTDDYDDEEKCDPAEVNRVLRWLRNKEGVDPNAAEVLESLQIPVEKPSTKLHADPWRALQSVRDKLKNITSQLETACAKYEECQAALKAADDVKEHLSAKKGDLAQEEKDLQQQALESRSSNQGDHAQQDDFESIVMQLRECFQCGVPEPQTERSAWIYKLLFGGQHGQEFAPTHSASPGSAAPAAQPRDTHFGVDVVGATFGPSKGTKAAASPYSMKPADDLAGASKGKGTSINVEPSSLGADGTPS